MLGLLLDLQLGSRTIGSICHCPSTTSYALIPAGFDRNRSAERALVRFSPPSETMNDHSSYEDVLQAFDDAIVLAERGIP